MRTGNLINWLVSLWSRIFSGDKSHYMDAPGPDTRWWDAHTTGQTRDTKRKPKNKKLLIRRLQMRRASQKLTGNPVYRHG